ncbi:MAG: hypothetical protein LBP25_03580, partial [Tannerellaceae bacterium]|nr:hypothetical protein [Tannerellaceae bacterium]
SEENDAKTQRRVFADYFSSVFSTRFLLCCSLKKELIRTDYLSHLQRVEDPWIIPAIFIIIDDCFRRPGLSPESKGEYRLNAEMYYDGSSLVTTDKDGMEKPRQL